MHRFPLSPGGLEVSRICYGLWRLGDDPEGASPARVQAKIEACLESGITTFDNADIYGGYTCEGLLGAALAEAPSLRAQMEIVTKCGINAPGPNRPGARVAHYDATAAAIERCVERSLRELRVETIDLLLIHRPDWLTSAEETARGLDRVRAAGKIRFAGVSNYTVSQAALLTQYFGPLATNQLEISLMHMEALYDGTLDQCQGWGIHPMAWSPLAKLVSNDVLAAMRTRAALTRIGTEYGATAEQMALAWVAALPSAPQLVVGTNRIERIREAAAADALTIERQHWYELWEAAQGRAIP